LASFVIAPVTSDISLQVPLGLLTQFGGDHTHALQRLSSEHFRQQPTTLDMPVKLRICTNRGRRPVLHLISLETQCPDGFIELIATWREVY
jgi:hypothetical protein